MLTRLYIDNFKCFVDFEYRPKRRQLILGANGSGKSSLLDALSFLRRVAVRGENVYDLSLLLQRTRWQNRTDQTFELEVALGGKKYTYCLVIGPEFERTRVKSEAVRLDGHPILEFNSGEVHTYNDSFEPRATYHLDSHCSALATPVVGSDTQELTLFRAWLRGLVCFRLNPFAMVPLSGTPVTDLAADLSNFGVWLPHVQRRYPDRDEAFLVSLREVFGGFEDFVFWTDELEARFRNEAGEIAEFRFNELSEGQRCLIGLYAVLHFVVAQGNTVILDEPDNFISLREIQPWLMAATDAIDECNGQLLLISHHPEIINQWAPECVRFVRDGIGPVRVEEFRGDPESALSPAELIARGWENG